MMYPAMAKVKKFSLDARLLMLLTRVNQCLSGEGVNVFLIGGLVRDLLFGRPTADIDLAVTASALEVAPKVARFLNGKYVLLDEVNQVGRVIVEVEDTRWELDFSTIKGSLEQDLARRDFTINAMAIALDGFVRNPRAAEITDPFGGQRDLARETLRAVSDGVFSSDPVRLLRAVRLAAELGFSTDSGTEALIRRDAHLIGDVPGERVREELLRLLVVPGSGKKLAYLDEVGLLTEIFLELRATRGVEQPDIHCWDVFQHSVKTVEAVEYLLREGNWDYAGNEALSVVPWSEGLVRYFSREVGHGSARRTLLKLAALLHDVAKPQTKSIEEDGRARFLGHAGEGAAMVVEILERLRFSMREIKLVELMVKHHLRPTQMSQEGMPTHRAMYRYFRDTADAGIAILFLNLADHLATRGTGLNMENWRQHAEMVRYILNCRDQEEKLTVPPKLVDGHDVMDRFGIEAGPKVGEVLEALREAQAAGEISTREEALAYIEHSLTSSSPTR
jgi:poly(A) polymerase